MGLLSTLIGTVAGLFVRKVTTISPDTGVEQTTSKPTKFTLGATGVIIFLLLHHLYFWPLLHYLWPEVGFPALDMPTLGAILSALGGM